MKISVAKERRAEERRVAASPDTAKRLVGLGHEVVGAAARGRGRGRSRGAGVAGRQAIGTARRLGGVVWATDVRLAAKEQVESLGAPFLVVDLEAMKAMETAGGYAKEMGDDFARRQREHVTEALKKTDIVICTALIPGRKAPVLITRAMLAVMRPGSVILDLAGGQGGKPEGSEAGKNVASPNAVPILG